MTRLEELALIARCVALDDRDAFGSLVEAYRPQVMRFLLHLTLGDHSLADDLAQETFIKAYLAIRSFKGLAQFRTWLLRIAYNEFYSEHRRAHEVRLDETMAAAVDNRADDAPSPDAAITVDQLLHTLNETERAAVTLFYIQDLPISRIALILDMPQGTVKSLLHRAKQKMAKRL